jgi:hypothetical protein
LLANIALSVLDEHVHGPWQPGGEQSTAGLRARRRAKGLPNWRIVRYADLCRARHKSAYADSRVMPRGRVAVHVSGMLGGLCSA